LKLVEFNLEVQQNIGCHFAPEGRDVYSLVLFFFCFLAPEEHNRFCSAGYRSAAGFRSYRSEIFLGLFVAINISLRWSESQFQCCTWRLNPPLGLTAWMVVLGERGRRALKPEPLPNH